MKERPKVGDRVEFERRGVRTGVVISVAETGVHFLVEVSAGHRRLLRQVGVHAIIRILPGRATTITREVDKNGD